MAVLLDFFQLAHVRANSICNLYRLEICNTGPFITMEPLVLTFLYVHFH